MTWRKRIRKAVAMGLYGPFVAWTAVRTLVSMLCQPRRVLLQNDEPDDHPQSLAFSGATGRFTGTVAVVLADRDAVAAALPSQLMVADEAEMPAWLPSPDKHPVILLMGRQQNLGRRKKLFGRFRNVKLFRPYLETFVAIPYVRTRPGQPGEDHSPCLHYLRVPCAAFWPTELGIHCMGYAKSQCAIHCREEDDVENYTIEAEDGDGLWLTAETDLSAAQTLEPNHESLAHVRAMLDQPLILIRGRQPRHHAFDWRFPAATTKAAPAKVTLHPSFLGCFPECSEFTLPPISENRCGAFRLETVFLNRRLDEAQPS